MNEELIVGLDIGTTKIACLVGLRNEHGKIEIIGMGKADSVGVNRGVVANIGQTVESIQKAVNEAASKANVDIFTVNVGIAGQHISSRQHRGMHTRKSREDEISQADIDALIDDMQKVVLPPGEEILHVIPQEYIVDNEQGIKDPVGMSGVRLEANFHIITGQSTAINNIYRCVRHAKLEIEHLMLEPLASSDAVLSIEDKEAGVALIDIGGGTTDIAIFQDGIIRHTAVIPFGGNVITEDIKLGCSILKKQAELLKVRFGSAMAMENQENDIICIPGLHNLPPKEISRKNLASIIQARMEEIIGIAHYEIQHSGFENQLIAGVVLTGGGAQLQHLPQLFEYCTGLHARIGYPNEHVGKVCNEEVIGPAYSTGIGLVLRGFQGKDAAKNQKLAENATVKGHSKGESRMNIVEKFKKLTGTIFDEEIN